MTGLSPAARPLTVAPVAGVRHVCNYINHLQQRLFRTTLDLALASPLPGGHLLSCSLPLCCSPCTFVYSLELEPSPELPLYIFLRVSCTSHLLVHYYCTTTQSRAAIYCCTTTAPLHSLMQPSTTAPLHSLVQPSTTALLLHHYIISCICTRASYCTIHIRASYCTIRVRASYCTIRTHASYCTIHVCASYCTIHTRAPCCTICIGASYCTIRVHASYCTIRTLAPYCTAPFILVHPSSPLVAPFERDLDHHRGKPTTFC